MSNDQVTVSKEVRDVKIARWEGFKRLAERLPNHHVLAVELIRTRNDQTAAVFTIVKDGRPFQTVVMGDAQGRVNPHDCTPRAAISAVARSADARIIPGADPGDDAASPDRMALGEPPPKQEPPAYVISLGTVLLASAFNLGEQGTGAPNK